MRVCVTGGTGFVGGALVRRFLAEGAEVRVLARPSTRADELEKQGAEVVRGDLSDDAAIERTVEGAEVVYHAAAKVEESGAKTEFVEVNVRGTQRVFEACMRKGVPHVVYLSSIAVYGLAKQGVKIDEATPPDANPEERDSYAHSKIEGDQYAAAMGSKTRLRVTILRPGVVYGPGRPLPIALLGFQLGKLQVAFGRPELRFPLTYIENLVDAILLASQSKGERLRTYIVIDDDNLMLKQYHKVRAEIDRTRTVFVPGWPLLLGPIVLELLARIVASSSERSAIWKRQIRRALQDRWYNTQNIREETGWAPRVPLREAIELTVRGNSETSGRYGGD